MNEVNRWPKTDNLNHQVMIQLL